MGTKPAVLAAAALLGVALALAGCGGSSSPGVAHLSSGTGPASANSGGGGASTESKASPEQAIVAFAKCMRSSGVPSFQEPHTGGTGQVPIGTNSAARSFKAAEAKCQKFMGRGRTPGSGSDPPSAKTLARWLKISQCMRKHGVSGFPDPTTSRCRPKPPAGVGEIADREGAILLIPRTIQQSPVLTRAAAACGSLSPTTDGKVKQGPGSSPRPLGLRQLGPGGRG